MRCHYGLPESNAEPSLAKVAAPCACWIGRSLHGQCASSMSDTQRRWLRPDACVIAPCSLFRHLATAVREGRG